MREIKIIGRNEAGEIRLQQSVPAFYDRNGNDITKQVVSILCACKMPTLLDKETQKDFRDNVLPVPSGYWHNIVRVWSRLVEFYASDAYLTRAEEAVGVRKERFLATKNSAGEYPWLHLPEILAKT